MTIREAYLKSRESLSTLYGVEEAIAISRRLFEDVFLIPHNLMVTGAGQPFTETEKLDECIRRLLKHEPLQHITGFEIFHGLRIHVSPDVLIPRPETAELVDWVLASVEQGKTRILADICTGSGCIALALRKYFPSAQVIATDISERALALAKKSEVGNFNDSRVQFERHDILNGSWPFSIPDIIVCNPPYIALSEAADMEKNVLEFEPEQALFVQDEDALLFYKRIIREFLPRHSLSIYFELNPLTAHALQDYCTQHGLQSEFRVDTQGKIRFARVYS